MASYVCPWWAASFALNAPFRRWIHDPRKIVGPYVKPGMTVLEVGCGIGWFTIPMAKMVGEGGKVIAVDLQPRMLQMLRRRAEKAGVTAQIDFRQCEQNRLGVDAQADFALVFAMLHEVPDQRRLLVEVFDCLKPGDKLLLAEPPIHVTKKMFAGEVSEAESAGFRLLDRPRLRWSHAALFEKPTIKIETA
jgi:ubiquinone/menaquinone biosynthesis C-methylase UbiE